MDKKKIFTTLLLGSVLSLPASARVESLAHYSPSFTLVSYLGGILNTPHAFNVKDSSFQENLEVEKIGDVESNYLPFSVNYNNAILSKNKSAIASRGEYSTFTPFQSSLTSGETARKDLSSVSKGRDNLPEINPTLPSTGVREDLFQTSHSITTPPIERAHFPANEISRPMRAPVDSLKDRMDGQSVEQNGATVQPSSPSIQPLSRRLAEDFISQDGYDFENQTFDTSYVLPSDGIMVSPEVKALTDEKEIFHTDGSEASIKTTSVNNKEEAAVINPAVEGLNFGATHQPESHDIVENNTIPGAPPPPPGSPSFRNQFLNELKKGRSLNKGTGVSSNNRNALMSDILKGVRLRSVSDTDFTKPRTLVDEIKEGNFRLRRAAPNDRPQYNANVHGISTDQLVDFRKTLRRVNRPATENNTGRVDQTALLGGIGNVNLDAIQQLEARLAQAGNLRHELKNVQLRKTARSNEFGSSRSEENTSEGNTELEKVLQKIRAKKQEQQAQQNKDARIASVNVFKAEQLLKEEGRKRESASKLQIGKPQTSSEGPTLMDQILSGFKLRKTSTVPTSMDLQVKAPESGTQSVGTTTSVHNPEEIISSPSETLLTSPQSEPVVTSAGTETSVTSTDTVAPEPTEVVSKQNINVATILQAIIPMNMGGGDEQSSLEPAELMNSLNTYKDFFNFNSTEIAQIQELLSDAPKTAIEWLQSEISKAQEYDPEWEDDGLTPYTQGAFFTLVQTNFQKEEPTIAVASVKKVGKLNLAAANSENGDWRAKIRALRKDEPEEVVEKKPVGKLNLTATTKNNGDLLAQIRAMKKEEPEVVVPVVYMAGQPSKEQTSEEEQVPVFTAPPPPPSMDQFNEYQEGLTNGKKLPTVEQLNKKHKVVVEERREDPMAAFRAAMLKRRVDMQEDDEDE